jgi:hypothetical protein
VIDTGDAVFVPSNWYHQVHNLDDCISINHNWTNAFAIDANWQSIKTEYLAVRRELKSFSFQSFGASSQSQLATNDYVASKTSSLSSSASCASTSEKKMNTIDKESCELEQIMLKASAGIDLYMFYEMISYNACLHFRRAKYLIDYIEARMPQHTNSTNKRYPHDKKLIDVGKEENNIIPILKTFSSYEFLSKLWDFSLSLTCSSSFLKLDEMLDLTDSSSIDANNKNQEFSENVKDDNDCKNRSSSMYRFLYGHIAICRLSIIKCFNILTELSEFDCIQYRQMESVITCDNFNVKNPCCIVDLYDRHIVSALREMIDHVDTFRLRHMENVPTFDV